MAKIIVTTTKGEEVGCIDIGNTCDFSNSEWREELGYRVEDLVTDAINRDFIAECEEEEASGAPVQ